MTQTFSSADKIADQIIRHVGNQVVVGLPIGVGKATHVVDALFVRACNDASISLTIFTGLTLEVPRANSDLEARFLKPLTDRLYGEWPTPLYADAVNRNALPANIKVREFYLRPGAYLGNATVQQNYSSINYSQVTAALLDLGVNVVLNLVAACQENPGRYSLSCNPEITLDLIPHFQALSSNGKNVALVGQVNRNLPYMKGDADIDASSFDFILDDPDLQFPLFSLPNRRVGPGDYATAMHVASLVRDGGTLQVGIGSLSDAVAHCLILRHTHPGVFADVLAALPAQYRDSDDVSVSTTPFEKGLFASTELMSDALYALFEAGIVRRPADDTDNCVIHAGFFIGSSNLYQRLRDLPDDQRSLINMTKISAVNTLFGDEATKRSQRRAASFVNETMMVTLLGAAVSDALDDGRVVSGVGGQFDFVSMAHSLNDAQSILMVRASRETPTTRSSNIRWSYGHATVPRHHRDVYVSEYGIAATRGKTDQQVIAAMIGISDAEFSASLMKTAKHARKLPETFNLHPDAHRNTLATIKAVFERKDVKPHFPPYPLGTELTDVEQQLADALIWLKNNTATLTKKLRVTVGAFLNANSNAFAAQLERMNLSTPTSTKERLAKRLVAYALGITHHENK